VFGDIEQTQNSIFFLTTTLDCCSTYEYTQRNPRFRTKCFTSLLQSALQPLWVLACTTVVEYSQQEGFYRVLLPAARQTPQLGGPVIRTFHLPPQGVPPRLKRRARTPVAEGGTMGEKCPRILPKVATCTSLLGSFTCRKLTTWDRRLYVPSEGRRAEDFSARDIRRLRPGLNPRTWLPDEVLHYAVETKEVPHYPGGPYSPTVTSLTLAEPKVSMTLIRKSGTARDPQPVPSTSHPQNITL
jgi:hypothetical protein